MASGYWPPSRRGKGNGNGNANGPNQRLRSLLGRKNRSDNDLPRQVPALPGYQIFPTKPHTTPALPENVRTILVAGSPECWNLTANADSFVPEACDASQLTQGSDTSTDWMPIEEEESYSSSQKHSQRQAESLGWLRGRKASPSLNQTKKKATKNHQMKQIKERPTMEPSSMIVIYKSPAQASGSPEGAVQVWLKSMELLVKSKEMADFLASTCDVVKVAGGIAVKAALLPVTVPLHVACATKDFVGWTLHQALSQTGVILQLTNVEDSHERTNSDRSESNQTAIAEPSARRSSGIPLVGKLFQVVPVVLQTAGRVKDEIGSAVIALVTPPQPRGDQSTIGSTERDQEVLDRLRIPGIDPKGKLEIPPGGISSGTTKADFTKFLLRVEDLGVTGPGDPTAVVYYIDLSPELRDEAILRSFLDKLASQGLALATSHAPGITPATTSVDAQVEWKPEGSTAKLLRKKPQQSVERWEETIRSEVLIWSGNFKNDCGGSAINREFSMFLARGIVERLSPRQFLELLWNNDRTAEYNNFCMGRKDVIQIDDKVLTSANVHSGTKVVRSETRVPFTGLSVGLCTMMHCRALPGGPQDGYIILSRSLVSGTPGYHTSHSLSTIEKSKNEILWGVNILRSVPDHPGQTDLTTVSQVASTMVPSFLSQRIGIMGVEDFFRSVRDGPKVASSPPNSASSAQM